MRCEPARPSHQALFEEIYRRELGAVRNFVRRLGTSSLYADDLAHDVILTAYERFDRLTGRGRRAPGSSGSPFGVTGPSPSGPRSDA